MGLTVNRTYITPIKSDGTVQDADAESTFLNGRGVFTLAALTTYYFILPVGASTMFDLHLTHDAAIVITTATIETCGHNKPDVPDFGTVAGEWVGHTPAGSYVPVEGAGTSATNGVVTTTGAAAGGAVWQVSENPAPRTRLEVAVGATGGEVRVSFTGKE